jgi:uncharacterized membrane protein SpoIIM required for sporulation
VNLEAFLDEREPAWSSLETVLAKAKGRPDRLGVEQALELGRDYRAAVADLAVARRRFPGDPVVERLERLVLAGRQAIYSERAERRGGLRRFVLRDYWVLVRERPGLLIASALALFGPCLLAAGWALHDPGAALGLLPARFRSAGEPHVRHLALGAATQASLASSIFTNNIQVTFLAFAGGLTFGLATLALLAFNGVLLGALGGIMTQAGSFSTFVRYVAPHGLLELSCIAVAGAAGLRLAQALVDPGDLPRAFVLRAAARPAVAIVLGTAPWLVLAGLTEGFVTPEGLPIGAALVVGFGLAATYWLLVFRRGRAPSR